MNGVVLKIPKRYFSTVKTIKELKPIQPKHKPTKVRFVKRGRYTVGETDRPVDMKAVKELLAN
jgi:hypothetical protein